MGIFLARFSDVEVLAVLLSVQVINGTETLFTARLRPPTQAPLDLTDWKANNFKLRNLNMSGC